jgi:serine/threonine protein kinase
MMFRKQDFKKMEPLGQGKKHTRIFKAVHLPTGQVFALKEIEAKSIDKLNEYKEEAVQLMKVQPHDNIIKFFGYYFHETNYGSFRLGIVTEFIEGGTCLESVFRRRKKAGLFWKEAELATMFSSLVSACAYLQLKNICHRDIKPANLFLKPNC